MKKLVLSIAIFITIGLVNQSNAQTPFSKLISGAGSFKTSELLADGSMLVSTTDNYAYSTLFKLDSDGNTMWSKTYNFIIDDLHQLASGNIAVIGYNNNIHYYGTIDNVGEVNWMKNYTTTSYSNYDLGHISQLVDGKLLFSYSKYDKNSWMKCDEYGYEEEGYEETDSSTYGKNPEFDSEGYEYGGWVSACKAEDRMALVRHDAGGNVVWSKTFGMGINYVHLKEIVALGNGEFLGLGMVTRYDTDYDNDGLVIKFNINGDILFANVYPMPANSGYFSTTFRNAIVKDGFMYVSGIISETSTYLTSNLLIKMDMNGEVISGYKIQSNSNIASGLSASVYDQTLTNEYFIYNSYDELGQVIINKVKYEETMGCNVVPFNTSAIEYGVFSSGASTSMSGMASIPVIPSVASVSSTINNAVITNACAAIASTEEELNLSLNTFPNPSTEIFTIQGLNLDREYNIQVIDLNGKVVLTESGINGVDMTTIQVGVLANGTYLINVIDAQSNATQKIKMMKM